MAIQPSEAGVDRERWRLAATRIATPAFERIQQYAAEHDLTMSQLLRRGLCAVIPGLELRELDYTEGGE